MSQILVCNLGEETLIRLKNRAKREGRSLKTEVKLILERAVKQEMDSAQAMLEEYRARFNGHIFSDSAQLIRQDRDR
jgi:plasmid stability protein